MTLLRGVQRAQRPGRRPPLAAVLLLHAVASLVALPAIHLVLVHGQPVAAAQILGSSEAPGSGGFHQATCPGCTLVRAPVSPAAPVARLVIPHVVVVLAPTAVSDVPSPLRSPPLGGRAPPLV
jgi:hypothetical protein